MNMTPKRLTDIAFNVIAVCELAGQVAKTPSQWLAINQLSAELVTDLDEIQNDRWIVRELREAAQMYLLELRAVLRISNDKFNELTRGFADKPVKVLAPKRDAAI